MHAVDRNTGDLKALAGRKWDVCIDNPTSLPFWVRDAAKVLKGNVGHYLFISTISVYADGSKSGIDENAALAAYKGKDAMAETQESLRADIEGLYGPLKALSEAEVRKHFGERSTIVRPGYIVGPRDDTDRFTYWPLRMERGGEVLVPGDGMDPVQVIDGRDLGEWMIRLAEAKTYGVFNAALEEHKVDLPLWVPPEGSPYSGYGEVSNARAIAAGLTFRPHADTVADLLAWFHALPADRQAKPRAGITAGREAKVLAAWKARGAG